MRIAFVIRGLEGGGPRVIMEYAKGLRERGHWVCILYPRRKTSAREIVRRLYLRVWYPRREEWHGRFSGEIVGYDTLTPELAGRNDIVTGVGASCVEAVFSLPGWCGVKVHNCHGRELQNMGRMLAAWRLQMPRIVVASYLEREMRQLGCQDEIYTVHNGVDRSEYFPCVPDEDRTGVGTVFHGAYTKGPELMLTVFERLHRLRPDLPLRMFGSYPRPAGLPKRTQYVRMPPVSVARDMYSRTKVWFCASRSEGFPGPVLEAMACGCALVSTDCGGSADQIEDGVNGFIVPIDNAERMTERILRFVDEPRLREQFVAATEASLERFTWPNAIRSLEAALTDIVAKAALRVGHASSA